MANQELAKILSEIALYLEMEDVPFKPQAYEKVAMILENLSEDVEEIYKRGGEKAIENIPSVGKSIADKIIEYIQTGKIQYYEDYKKRMPVKIEELTAVEGIGPKKVKALWQNLKIKDLKDLEKAAREHKIQTLFGFDKKSEKNILQAIEFLKKSKGRFLLGEILPKAKEIEKELKGLKEVEEVSVAGSVRRRKETIGDLDFLVTLKKPNKETANKIMDFFVSLPGVIKIWSKGTTRSSIRLKNANVTVDCDLRVVNKKSYGSALQYFTGSKEHNIATRVLAIKKGLKLNEYGVFKGKNMVAGWSESGVYRSIGLPWIEPELRENRGEIEAALRQQEGKKPGLPKIISYNDIKGDLHCHSNWNGGEDSIEDLAREAMKMGYQYLGISDHTKFLRIERGLDEKQLEKQRKEIDKINSKFKIQNLKFKILQGCEANILPDGSIDIQDEFLKKLDYVIAGVHSAFKMPKEKMTKRIIRAMKNPNVDIISHPTGRILKKRDEYQIDFDEILRVAKETNTILEINSYPERLDLNDINIKKAKEAGVKMVINTDTHQKDQLRYIEFGIAMARRGWAEKNDIINTYSLEEILNNF
ncbi:MAG TPA: DNA polymerase/3'-5' exonuclease PolX [Candidatus Paceibacterota bacterium]|nr:DNA polymerase/3'-5' exonuclease PolX [Candidatus Pacearchaeota archaeon]HPZ74254.1 DNA polymerase/3'-5' exonuclease PolX [Candidatus Pacearchaeota archaeon]HQD88984.1 DNA polymerase/3'-5' exonuclease PolX [Candidatus Pacearchaeota archaeon]HRR39253.1 DNA polymerase/3'-5' exonuclease PolX [Candidatus Paceibacterota bacterium]